jgi:predicted nucleic acid-binding protein
VPAIRHALTEFPPRRLYPDTNFLLNVLVPSYPFHAAASGFLIQIAAAGMTTLYVSSLTWLEFGNAVLRADFRAGLAADLQREYRLDDWGAADVRDDYLAAMLNRLYALLSGFDRYDVAVTLDVSVHALQLMGQHGLRWQDAAHVACAQAVGVVDVVSFDSAFRRVDGLYLWTV